MRQNSLRQPLLRQPSLRQPSLRHILLGFIFCTAWVSQAAEWQTIPLDAAHFKTAAVPHNLVAGDFDHDGMPDVMVVDATGRLLWFRGELDVLFPNTSAAKKRRVLEGEISPFSPGVMVGQAFAADFIVSGDFDTDGKRDLLLAERGGSTLHVLPGLGDGSFVEARELQFDGPITALVAGEIDRYDGLPGFVVATDGGAGSMLHIFNDSRGALKGAAVTLPLDGPVDQLILGQFDDIYYDIVAAGDDRLFFIPGAMQQFGEGPERASHVIHETALDAPIAALTNKGRDAHPQLGAVLSNGSFMALDLNPKVKAPLSARSVGAISLDGEIDKVMMTNHLSGADLIVRRRDEVLVRSADGVERQFDRAALKRAPELGPAMTAMRTSPLPGSELVSLTTQADRPLMVLSLRGAEDLWIVNDTGSSDDGVCDAHCTLADAISAANASPNPDVISFAGLGSGDSIQTQIAATLNDQITLDGSTHPDGRVEIRASLSVRGDNTTLRNLTFLGQAEEPVTLFGVANPIVEGCWFGVTANGTALTSPALEGTVIVSGATNALVGGTTIPARNLFGINGRNLQVAGQAFGAKIYNNYFHLQANGVDALPSFSSPDLISISSLNMGTMIGGPDVNQGNVIFKAFRAIVNSSPTEGTTVQGNIIGLNAQQQNPENLGLAIGSNRGEILIGGEAQGAGNVVGSFSGFGVDIFPDPGQSIEGGVIISGNYIGMNPAGDRFGGFRAVRAFGLELVMGTETAPNFLAGAFSSVGLEISRVDHIYNFLFGFQFPLDTFTLGKPTLVAAGEQNGELLITYNTAGMTPETEYDYPLDVFFYLGADEQGQAIIGQDTYTLDDFNNGDKTVNLGLIDNLVIQRGSPMIALARDINGHCSDYSNTLNAPPERGDVTFVVNSDDDLFDGICDQTHCSLVDAVYLGRQNNDTTRIHFNIPGNGPFEIPSGRLGDWQHTLILDGSTQPGYAGEPLITLRRNTSSPDALELVGVRNALIRGIRFLHWSEEAVRIRQGTQNQVLACVFEQNGFGLVAERTFNLTVDGNSFLNNTTGFGATDDSTNITFTNNVVGASFDLQTLLGNTEVGAELMGTGHVVSDNLFVSNGTGIVASGDVHIRANHIGLLPAVNRGAQNQNVGVDAGAGVLVGGLLPEDRNIIAGNNTGLILGGQALGNYIGTDETGLSAVPNGVGVSVVDGGQLGDGTQAGRNLISGNSDTGVMTSGAFTVDGNWIGLNSSGQGFVPNGVGVRGAGTGTVRGNLINGNTGAGAVLIQDGLTLTGNTLSGNVVGVDVQGGDHAIGTALHGNHITDNTSQGVLLSVASTVENNTITGNGDHGVQIEGDGAVVRGNRIGVDEANRQVGNQGAGVRLLGATGVMIGGATDDAGNTISGNMGSGVEADTAAVIRFNRIGTGVDGMAGVGNQVHGLALTGSGHEVRDNLISGNGGNGVALSASGSVLTDNRIGLATDNSALGNGGFGVLIDGDFSDNRIGAAEGESTGGNTIAYNGGDGIRQTSGARNRYSQNAIFDNNGLAIDLGGDGVTANDLGDSDVGPNSLLNFPTVNAVTGSGGQTTIAGVMNGDVTELYDVEIYSVSACDASGFGEAGTYLGTVRVATDFVGQAPFELTMPTNMIAGDNFAALAINLAGDTSELGPCFEGVLFADGFESGDVSAWSTTSRGQVSAGLDVGNDAAYGGLFGLQVTASSGGFVQHNLAQNLADYRARVYVQANSLSLNSGQHFPFLQLLDDANQPIVQVGVQEDVGLLRLYTERDGVQTQGPLMTRYYTAVELIWDAGNESYEVLLDGAQAIFDGPRGTGGAAVSAVAIGDLGTTGSGLIRFDDFASAESSSLGLVPCPSEDRLEQELRNWPIATMLDLVAEVNRTCPADQLERLAGQ